MRSLFKQLNKIALAMVLVIMLQMLIVPQMSFDAQAGEDFTEIPPQQYSLQFQHGEAKAGEDFTEIPLKKYSSQFQPGETSILRSILRAINIGIGGIEESEESFDLFSSDDTVAHIATDSDGNVWVTGQFKGRLMIDDRLVYDNQKGEATEFSYKDDLGYVAKFNNNGDYLFSLIFLNKITGIATDSVGNAWVNSFWSDEWPIDGPFPLRVNALSLGSFDFSADPFSTDKGSIPFPTDKGLIFPTDKGLIIKLDPFGAGELYSRHMEFREIATDSHGNVWIPYLYVPYPYSTTSLNSKWIQYSNQWIVSNSNSNEERIVIGEFGYDSTNVNVSRIVIDTDDNVWVTGQFKDRLTINDKLVYDLEMLDLGFYGTFDELSFVAKFNNNGDYLFSVILSCESTGIATDSVDNQDLRKETNCSVNI